MNTCYFMGNLGRDPDVKATKTGKAVARFSIGCSRKYGDKEYTDWINVVAWGNLAEGVGDHLKKGTFVFVKGRWSTRAYDDPKSGEKKYITELVADTISIPIGVGKKKDTASSNQQPTTYGDVWNNQQSQRPPQPQTRTNPPSAAPAGAQAFQQFGPVQNEPQPYQQGAMFPTGDGSDDIPF